MSPDSQDANEVVQKRIEALSYQCPVNPASFLLSQVFSFWERCSSLCAYQQHDTRQKKNLTWCKPNQRTSCILALFILHKAHENRTYMNLMPGLGKSGNNRNFDFTSSIKCCSSRLLFSDSVSASLLIRRWMESKSEVQMSTKRLRATERITPPAPTCKVNFFFFTKWN